MFSLDRVTARILFSLMVSALTPTVLYPVLYVSTVALPTQLHREQEAVEGLVCVLDSTSDSSDSLSQDGVGEEDRCVCVSCSRGSMEDYRSRLKDTVHTHSLSVMAAVGRDAPAGVTFSRCQAQGTSTMAKHPDNDFGAPVMTKVHWRKPDLVSSFSGWSSRRWRFGRAASPVK